MAKAMMINRAAAAYWMLPCANQDDTNQDDLAILIVIGAAPNPV
jgi:hypothetical protein